MRNTDKPCKEVAGKWYERIELEPYNGDEDDEALALSETLRMKIWFDDVNTETCRFTYRDSWNDPTVDYDIENEELTEWFEGKKKLVLVALEHDEERFPDMVYRDPLDKRQ